jgi:uncharacterized protein (TIGR03067 family)
MLTLFLLIGLGAGNAQDKQEANDAKLQGKWKMTASSRGPVKGEAMVFEGDRFRSYNPSGEVESEGTFVARPDKTPKEIDLIVERKGQKHVVRGIYVLDGATLKTAHHAVRENSVRPTDFKGGGQDVRITVFERAK